MTIEFPPGADLRSLLVKIGFEVRVIRDVSRRLASTTAPDFSVFDFVRTDEMGISACVAALLDPRGAHGQGPTFLRLFLETVGTSDHDWFERLDLARVLVEAPANGMRRLDIYVQFPNGRAIAVENKPWATDQDLQLTDYARFLQATCRPDGWKLVYLSDRAPSQKSIEREQLTRYVDAGCLYLMTFGVLANWLLRCVAETRPIAVRVFLEHMEQFIRTRMCGEADMSESQAIKEIVLASPETLRAAILVDKSMGAIKQQLLRQNLRVPFENELVDLQSHLVWDDQLSEVRAYAGFGARFAPEAPGYLRYEFERSGLNGLFWGIRRHRQLKEAEPEHPAAAELMRVLGQAFGRGASSSYWFWWSTNMGPLSSDQSALSRDWERTEQPWLRLQDGSLARDLLQHVKRVRQVLQVSSAAQILGVTRNLSI